ncbi:MULTISPECIES: DUF6527 family protein [Ralstonia]|uniref:DUF6527 family protein n=1 Tax=Ralstonia TaxID=48736 RepID=UPI000A6B764A|nr:MULTISPECIES: DUF6527 family protein [Ralstonia]MBY4707145.1 hypothetical protein [Ralstonia insidiosa]
MDEGVLYISEKFSTAAHICCCGCGMKIVTPLKPGRWKLRKQNGVVSLHLSVGNWSSGCQSHYWIEGNPNRVTHDSAMHTFVDAFLSIRPSTVGVEGLPSPLHQAL